MSKQGEVSSAFLSLLAWALERGGLQSCGADAELEAFAGRRVKADPNSDEWDDLDTEDMGGPLMVSEYASEIFSYMQSLEVSHNLSKYFFMILHGYQ